MTIARVDPAWRRAAPAAAARADEHAPEPPRARSGLQHALARALGRGERLSPEELATLHPDDVPPGPIFDPFTVEFWR